MQHHRHVSGRRPQQIGHALAWLILEQPQGDDLALHLAEALHASQRLDVCFRVRDQRLDGVFGIRQGAQHLRIAEVWAGTVVAAPPIASMIADQHDEDVAAVLQLVRQSARVRQIEKRRQRLLHRIEGVLREQSLPPGDRGQRRPVLSYEPRHPGEEADIS